MRVVVNDANVLIDLVELDLHEHFFQLPFEFHATSLVLGEIEEYQRQALDRHIYQSTLHIHEPDEEEREEISELSRQALPLSDNDLSAFLHAQRVEGILLTSDDKLRKYGKENGVEYHGHLWVFDQLVGEGMLNGGQASRKLDELKEVNPILGLPKGECEKRKVKWKGA